MSARSLVSLAALGAALVVAGCGRNGGSGGGGGMAATCDDAGPCALSCGPGIDAPPNEGAQHVPEPTPVTYQANPPASGPHWPMWQEPWGAYPMELPRERWVHNLEHGGIVLLYNCPSGCDGDVAALQAIIDGTPPDKFNEQRFLLTPDTVMPHRFAAVAWGWRWQGEAVDAPTIQCFVQARYDRAPESIP